MVYCQLSFHRVKHETTQVHFARVYLFKTSYYLKCSPSVRVQETVVRGQSRYIFERKPGGPRVSAKIFKHFNTELKKNNNAINMRAVFPDQFAN